jgi:site-specific DNA-cytosine methylase
MLVRALNYKIHKAFPSKLANVRLFVSEDIMKAIELFAGAGGLALGTEKAGFKHVAVAEWNSDACSTLRLNRPEWNIVEGDVRQLTYSDFG